MKNIFKGRTVGAWLGFAAAMAALAADVVYIATNYGDKTFSMAVFILVLAAAVMAMAAFVLPFADLSIISCLLLAGAAGMQCYVSMPTISDIWNNVVFIGGDRLAAVLYLVLFSVCALIAAISLFLRQRKQS